MIKYFQKNEVIAVFVILVIIFCQMFFNEYYSALEEFEKNKNNIVYQIQFQKFQDDYLLRFLKDYSLEYFDKIIPNKEFYTLVEMIDEEKYIARNQEHLKGELYGELTQEVTDELHRDINFAISLDSKFQSIAEKHDNIKNMYYFSENGFIYKWPKTEDGMVEEIYKRNNSQLDENKLESSDSIVRLDVSVFDKLNNYYGVIRYEYDTDYAYSFLDDSYSSIIENSSREIIYTNIYGRGIDNKTRNWSKQLFTLARDKRTDGEILISNGHFYYVHLFSDGTSILQTFSLKDALLQSFKATIPILLIAFSYIIFLIFKYRYEKSTEKLNEAMEELDSNYDKLKIMANTDFLTNMYNRAGFTSAVTEFINENKTIIIVIADIDKFKVINDNYGHEIGDMVLKEVSKTMKTELSSKDVIGRWGGEEFVIAFTGTSEERVYNISQKLREKIMEIEVDARELGIVKLSASFGIAKHYSKNGSFINTISKADEALYYSKNNGRNRVTKYSDLNL